MNKYSKYLRGFQIQVPLLPEYKYKLIDAENSKKVEKNSSVSLVLK